MWKEHVDVHNTYRGEGQTRERGKAKMLITSVHHGGYWLSQNSLELGYWAYIKMNHNQSIGGVFILLPPRWVYETKPKKTFSPKLLENSWTCPSLFILWCSYNSISWPFKCIWVGMVKCHLFPLSPPPPNASPKVHQRRYYLAVVGLWAMTTCLSSYHTIFKKY